MLSADSSYSSSFKQQADKQKEGRQRQDNENVLNMKQS
jgi:hypothetical protein